MATKAFIDEQLELSLSRVIQQPYPALRYENGEFIPTMADLDLGVSRISQRVLDEAGQAAFWGGEGGQIPVADISVSERTYPVRAVAAGYRVSEKEIAEAERARRNGELDVPLGQRKAMMAARAIAEKVDSIVAYGEPGQNFTGFLSDPGVEVVDSSFDFYNTANTAEAQQTAIFEFFQDQISTVIGKVERLFQPTHVLLPLDVFNRLNIATVDANNILLEVLQRQLAPYGIQTITWDNRLNAQQLFDAGVRGDANKDRLVFYTRSPEVIERHTGVLQQAERERSNMMEFVPYYQVISPPQFHYPETALYVDVPVKS
jgi:hypothetical protein